MEKVRVDRRREGPARPGHEEYNPRAAAEQGRFPPMPRRIVVTLPEKTVALLDRNLIGVTRSWVVDRAIRTFFGIPTARTMNERLKEGYIANAESTRRLAEDWGPLPWEEAWWEGLEAPGRRGEASTRGAGRSTTSSSTRRSGRRSARRGRR